MKSWKKDEAGTRKIGKAVWGRKRERKTSSNGTAGEKEFGKRRQKVQKGFRKCCCAGWVVSFPCWSRLGHEKISRYFGQEGN